MTTIAYRNGVMAADGRITLLDTVLTSHSTKIHRLDDGALCGVGGDAALTAPLLAFLNGEEGSELPNAPGDLHVILVETDGTIKLYCGSGGFEEIPDHCIAIGTGAAFAYGAMEVGASALEAVEAAIKRDPQSGGRVQVEELGLARKKRKAK